ncbi:MAG: sulfurtransferase FdhD [Proteobacteria bacterium]|nr:MAG: sulfurtransferase FdhD [Pseudomonadota bacterium]
MVNGYQTLPVQHWEPHANHAAQDHIAEEQAVALVYNCVSHAVMMVSPLDLEDFALGFSLTEGIIEKPTDIVDCVMRSHPLGMEIKLELSPTCFKALQKHRRNLTGRTGCGLCGAESLQQAMRPIKTVSTAPLPTEKAIQTALDELAHHQPLQALTGALHGAAWCDLDGYIQLVREDIGRHNALDKLIGALHHRAINRHNGFVLVSSRASYEMVQKVCSADVPTLVAVSAPTTLAISLARQAGLNLIGFARPSYYNIYTP